MFPSKSAFMQIVTTLITEGTDVKFHELIYRTKNITIINNEVNKNFDLLFSLSSFCNGSLHE